MNEYYTDSYTEKISEKLSWLRKKDPAHLLRVIAKINDILSNPRHSYKFLSKDMKGANRVHIGHFVLVFAINRIKRTISFEDYDHHDKIYRK